MQGFDLFLIIILVLVFIVTIVVLKQSDISNYGIRAIYSDSFIVTILYPLIALVFLMLIFVVFKAYSKALFV